MSVDFTPTAYRELLESFMARSYQAVSFQNASPVDRHLILRHDLDMSLDAALPIAEIECELEAVAHYFVLLRSEMYNTYTPNSMYCLSRIVELGHEIGLHFDASQYNSAEIDEKATSECRILEDMLGREVTLISFHRPASELLGHKGLIAGRRHTYEPTFFCDMGYSSDSRGGWHRGHPLENEAVVSGRALQLLTHPIWWLSPPLPAKARLDRFLNERDNALDRALAKECDIHIAGRRPSVPAPTHSGEAESGHA